MKNGSNVIIKKHITRNGYKQPNNRLHSQTATLRALLLYLKKTMGRHFHKHGLSRFITQ